MASLTTATLALALVLSAQAIKPGTPFGSTAVPGSARTLISVVTTTQPDGQRRLELLVVWRGSAGWFLKRGDNSSSGGGSGQTFSSTVRYGGTEVSFEVIFAVARRVILPDRAVDLGDHNVVLVDDVDAVTGPRFVKSLRIDPAMEDLRPSVPAVAGSSELVEFLQCTVKLESVGAQRTTDGLCDEIARIR